MVRGGGMLHSFVAFFPQASVYAYDVSSHNYGYLSRIAKKFWSDFESIDEKFDFISMIYCLEHIFDVKKEILRIKELLEDEGVLMVQVPNIAENLWDIFVYDHIHHFSVNVLACLLETLGFSVTFPKDQMDRGITILAKKSNNARLTLEAKKTFLYPHKRLQKNLKVLEGIVENKEKVAVFGSAINSTFIGEYLGDSLEVFLDEDERKIGKTHLKVKIIHPVKFEGKVVMPYGGNIIERIKAKYSFPFIEVY